MTAAIEPPPQPRGFWADLTGASDRWGRTILYAVAIGRLSMLALGIVVLLAFGEGGVEGFTGFIESVDAATIFAAVFAAPFLESLILALIVWAVGFKLKASRAVTAVVAGLAFIPQHGLAAASVMVAPFFALEALILMNWMRRGEGGTGFWLVFVIHAVANSLSVLAAATLGPADL